MVKFQNVQESKRSARNVGKVLISRMVGLKKNIEFHLGQKYIELYMCFEFWDPRGVFHWPPIWPFFFRRHQYCYISTSFYFAARSFMVAMQKSLRPCALRFGKVSTPCQTIEIEIVVRTTYHAQEHTKLGGSRVVGWPVVGRTGSATTLRKGDLEGLIFTNEGKSLLLLSR